MKIRIHLAIVIFALVALINVLNIVWLTQDDSSFLHDPHYRYRDFIDRSNGEYFSSPKNLIIPNNIIHLPVFAVTQALGLTPSEDLVTCILAILTTCVLALGIIGIGTLVFNKKTGILALFIFFMYPVVFNHLKLYLMDLPLTAAVCLSVFLMLALLQKKELPWATVVALMGTCIIGILIKPNFLLFAVPPLLLGVTQRWTGSWPKEKPTCINPKTILRRLVVFSIVGVGVLLLLFMMRLDLSRYLSNMPLYWSITRYKDLHTSSPETASLLTHFFTPLLLTIKGNISFLAQRFFYYMVSPWLAILFLISLPLMLDQWYANKNSRILLVWLIVPVVVLVFVFDLRNPVHERYYIPILPVIALLVANFVYEKTQTLKTKASFALIAFVGLCGWQYSLLSFTPFFANEPAHFSIPFLATRMPLDYRIGHTSHSYPVSGAQLHTDIDTLMNTFSAHIGDRNRVKVFFLSDTCEIYEPLYTKYRHRLPDRGEEGFWMSINDYTIDAIGLAPKQAIANNLQACNFVVLERYPSLRMYRQDLHAPIHDAHQLVRNSPEVFQKILTLYFNGIILTDVYAKKQRTA